MFKNNFLMHWKEIIYINLKSVSVLPIFASQGFSDHSALLWGAEYTENPWLAMADFAHFS